MLPPLVPKLTGALLAICLVPQETTGQRRTAGPPAPQDAIPALLRAFDQHPIVAIGEQHRDQGLHDFVVSLVSAPGFTEHVQDVVVEFGAARHQSVADRYVAGDSVTEAELCRVWRETVNILVWDAPVYRRFFETVRRVNERLPAGKKIRVHLGDPVFDWEQIQTNEQWEKLASQRDAHAAEMVERVLAQGRRVLILYGGGHVMRERAFARFDVNPVKQQTENLTELLDSSHPTKVFGIWTHTGNWGDISTVDSRLRGWKNPSLAVLRGTWLGATGAGPANGSPRMQELADALLYLGPIAAQTESKPSDDLYRDHAYLRELLRRDRIQGRHNRVELERLVKVTGLVP